MILGVLEDVLELPPRQKLMGLVAALVVAGFLNASYWYGPRQSGLGELRTQIAQRRTEPRPPARQGQRA